MLLRRVRRYIHKDYYYGRPAPLSSHTSATASATPGPPVSPACACARVSPRLAGSVLGYDEERSLNAASTAFCEQTPSAVFFTCPSCALHLPSPRCAASTSPPRACLPLLPRSTRRPSLLTPTTSTATMKITFKVRPPLSATSFLVHS